MKDAPINLHATCHKTLKDFKKLVLKPKNQIENQTILASYESRPTA